MTVFQKIIDGTLSSKKVFENEHLIAIEDIAPIAPVHILIIPKKPIISMQHLIKEDFFLIQEIFQVAQDLAEEFNIADGYRFLTNNGSDAGQTVLHLHFHLIGGKRLGPLA